MVPLTTIADPLFEAGEVAPGVAPAPEIGAVDRLVTIMLKLVTSLVYIVGEPCALVAVTNT